VGLFKKMKDAAQMGGEAKAMQDQAAAEHGGLGGAMSARDEMIRKGQEAQRLRETGLPGKAVILEARDTGERSFGNAVLDLDLAVTMDSGEEYRTTLTGFMIAGTDMGPYAAGSEYGVRVDPADRDTLTFA
jgi:hypothetical protein